MAIRLHELHPTLVHFPLALVPAALVADIVGKVSGNRWLMKMGQALMPAAAVSGVVAGTAGLVAQEAVEAQGEAHDLLITHRNLNLALVGLTGLLAAVRARREEPGLGYLLMGIAGFAAMNYTAYLGGKMVYHYGVGVEGAGGLRKERSPELTVDSLGTAGTVSMENAMQAVRHAAQHLRAGDVAPALRRHA